MLFLCQRSRSCFGVKWSTRASERAWPGLTMPCHRFMERARCDCPASTRAIDSPPIVVGDNSPTAVIIPIVSGPFLLPSSLSLLSVSGVCDFFGVLESSLCCHLLHCLPYFTSAYSRLGHLVLALPCLPILDTASCAVSLDRCPRDRVHFTNTYPPVGSQRSPST